MTLPTSNQSAMRFLGALFVPLLLAGCPADGSDVRPPRNSFYFPSALQVTPDEQSVIVANSNFDLRYDSATLQLLDVQQIVAIASDWKSGTNAEPDGCEVATDINGVLQCDESSVLSSSIARIGNFASGIAIQSLSSGDYRLYIAVRGDPSITWVDYLTSEKTITCSSGSSTFPLCDRDHQMLFFRGQSNIGSLFPEPFQMHIDSTNGFGVITHLSSDAISVFDAPTDGNSPQLADAVTGIFGIGAAGGSVGIAGRPSSTDPAPIYVTSQSDSQVQTLVVTRDLSSNPTAIVGEPFFLGAGTGESDDARAIRFRADGERAYILNRSPNLLHILDTSLDETLTPKNELIGAIEICPNATGIASADFTGIERIFVTCFAAGEVWILDPLSQQFVAAVPVGRGPSSLSLATNAGLLFVSNAQENTVAVVDVDPTSITHGRLLLRLGDPVGASQ